MCVGCLVTSAILTFSPVQTGTAPQQPQANLTQQKQIAIAPVIKQLPASNDVKLLREGLESIQGQLSVAIDDSEAQQILRGIAPTYSDNFCLAACHRLSNSASVCSLKGLLAKLSMYSIRAINL